LGDWFPLPVDAQAGDYCDEEGYDEV
jgi:hypothetical protein